MISFQYAIIYTAQKMKFSVEEFFSKGFFGFGHIY